MAQATYQSNTGTLLKLKLYVNASPVHSGNYSAVNVRGVLCHSRISVGGRNGNYVQIGNTPFSYNAPAVSRTSSGSYETELFNFTANVPHNADGSGSAKIYAAYAFNGTYSGVRINNIVVDSTITLDNINVDTSGPVITEFHLADITQTSVRYVWSSPDDCDWAWYSLDGGGTWYDLPSDNIITGLSPNTSYSFVFSLRKTSNKAYTNSGAIWAQTLPIYIQSVSIADLSVDENQVVSITPDIYPPDASIKELAANAVGNSAKITQSTVTGVTKGQTTFTLTATDGSGVVSNTCTVTVIRRVTGITAPFSRIQMAQDTTYALNCTVVPDTANNDLIIYESSNSSVASVDSGGNITAHTVDSCTVTARTSDGGYTAEIRVDVTGELSWADIDDVPEFVNFWDLNNIYQNQRFIRNKLIGAGEEIEVLEVIECTGGEHYSKMPAVYEALQNNFVKLSEDYIKAQLEGEPDYFLYKKWLELLNYLKSSTPAHSDLWLWDPFSFAYGKIYGFKDVPVDGGAVFTVLGSNTSPVISVSAPMTLSFGGNTYSLTAGDNSIPELILPKGESQLTFTGNGKVSVKTW